MSKLTTDDLVGMEFTVPIVSNADFDGHVHLYIVIKIEDDSGAYVDYMFKVESSRETKHFHNLGCAIDFYNEEKYQIFLDEVDKEIEIKWDIVGKLTEGKCST